jgi:hypothetical protein
MVFGVNLPWIKEKEKGTVPFPSLFTGYEQGTTAPRHRRDGEPPAG